MLACVDAMGIVRLKQRDVLALIVLYHTVGQLVQHLKLYSVHNTGQSFSVRYRLRMLLLTLMIGRNIQPSAIASGIAIYYLRTYTYASHRDPMDIHKAIPNTTLML
jgi:hypothetical protein